MTCPIRYTSLFLGLQARARDAPHQSTDNGHSAPVNGRKKIAREGDTQNQSGTDIATTRPDLPSYRAGIFSGEFCGKLVF